MHPVNAPPSVPRQISAGCHWVLTLEDLRHGDGAHPEPRAGMGSDPGERRTLPAVCDLVEEIDEKRRTEECLPHDLRATRSRSSPRRLEASSSTSAPVAKGLLADEHAHIGRTLHPGASGPTREQALLFLGETHGQYTHGSAAHCISFVCQPRCFADSTCDRPEAARSVSMSTRLRSTLQR